MTSILQNKEAVERAIEGASSTREALHRLGLRSAGGNYAAFKQACQKFNITQPIGKADTTAARLAVRIPLQDILIENSSYTSRDQIKKRCYAESLLKEKCYKCGIGPEWQGQHLTLQLEHKNGIHNDHRIENLEILCPNCHSQTDSFGGKRAIFYCVCGRVRHKTSKLCRTCNNKLSSQTRIQWPSIEELQERLAKSNYSALGRELGVSDNAIRKHLKRSAN